MKPLDFEMWCDDDGYTPECYSGDNIDLLALPARTLCLRLIDYHHNYLRLRRHITELEGKIYSLEEHQDGRG